MSSQPYDWANVTEAVLQSGLDRPLYLQLLDWLREDLSRRQPGARIDSEPQLAQRFGVSRFTVTRAIEILVRDGLLTRRQGLGTFVAPPRLRRAPTYLRSFTEAMAAEGRTATHRLLDFALINGADGHNFPYAERNASPSAGTTSARRRRSAGRPLFCVGCEHCPSGGANKGCRRRSAFFTLPAFSRGGSCHRTRRRDAPSSPRDAQGSSTPRA